MPELAAPDDAIVRIDVTGVCGSICTSTTAG